MFSKSKARLVVFVAAAATLGGVLFVYVTPASTNVNPVPVDHRPGIANNATIEPWSNYLSEGAVESGGIENDLDGNASALVPSDCMGLSTCRNP
jgi:hypothetical protein